MPDTKYLIETSAVLGALGYSTKKHNEYVEQELLDGSKYSSVYIRKEVIGRFICDIIELAVKIEMCPSAGDAVIYTSQKWGRKSKIGLMIIGWIVNSGKKFENSHEMAFEVANIAFEMLELFDIKFEAKIQNKCGCSKGKLPLNVDFRNGISELNDFRTEFLIDCENCPVNDFVQIGKDKGRLAALVGDPKLQANAAIRNAIHTNLTQVIKSGQPLTCKSCNRIGDAIIAMEQPNSWKLVHVDHSFNTLCDYYKRPHKLLLSSLSFEPKPGGS